MCVGFHRTSSLQWRLVPTTVFPSSGVLACSSRKQLAHHLMLISPTIISPCRVFWIACQRSGATAFLPKDTPFFESPGPSSVITAFRRGALFSHADRNRTSGSGAGSAVTSSGPEGTPKDPPATKLSPDIVAPVRRSTDKAATQAFEAGRQVYAGANAFLRFHVAPLLASELRIPCSVIVRR